MLRALSPTPGHCTENFGNQAAKPETMHLPHDRNFIVQRKSDLTLYIGPSYIAPTYSNPGYP
jgi:hypothetical protein